MLIDGKIRNFDVYDGVTLALWPSVVKVEYDVCVRSDVGVRDVDDLMVIGNLLSLVVDGLKVIMNNKVASLSNVEV